MTAGQSTNQTNPTQAPDGQTAEYKRAASYTDYSIDLDKVYYHRLREQARAYFGSREGGGLRLLDVGCFDGGLARLFAGAFEVHGLEGNVEACRRAVASGVRAVLHDLEKPFPHGTSAFDCVVAAEIIEHVYDTDFFLQEIRRVLKPEGLLVMSVSNIACLTNRVKMLFGGYPRYAEYRAGGAGHIRVYTARAIREQLIANGFRIRSFVGCNLPMPMHHRAVPKWLKRLAVRGGDYFPGIAGQVILSATPPR